MLTTVITSNFCYSDCSFFGLWFCLSWSLNLVEVVVNSVWFWAHVMLPGFWFNNLIRKLWRTLSCINETPTWWEPSIFRITWLLDAIFPCSLGWFRKFMIPLHANALLLYFTGSCIIYDHWIMVIPTNLNLNQWPFPYNSHWTKDQPTHSFLFFS